MKTKIITAFLAAALLTAAFTGCNTSSDSVASPETSAAASSDEAKLEKKTFNLGHLNSTAHLLGFVAKEEGFFEEEGLDVTLTLFSSAAELTISSTLPLSAPFPPSPSKVRVTTSPSSAAR